MVLDVVNFVPIMYSQTIIKIHYQHKDINTLKHICPYQGILQGPEQRFQTVVREYTSGGSRTHLTLVTKMKLFSSIGSAIFRFYSEGHKERTD